MAGEAGSLGRIIVPAYYRPLAQAHGTLASAIYRLSENKDGSFFVDPTTNRAEASRSFQFAHLIMLGVLTVQNEHFTVPELDKPLGEAWKHYKSAWGYSATEPSAG